MFRRIASLLCPSVALGLLAAAPALAGELVVVMSANAAPVTKEYIADVYLGRSNALKPLDLPESNELRDAFYRKVTDRDAAQIKAVWSRIIFTGQGHPPKELPDPAAVKKAVASDPKMVGYIDNSDVDASVKVVLSLH
jgi:hypothetical protein